MAEGRTATTQQEQVAWGDAKAALDRILTLVESDKFDDDAERLLEIRVLAYRGLDRRPPWAP